MRCRILTMGRAWEYSLRPGRDWPFILVVCVGVCAAIAAGQNPAIPPKPHASPIPRLIILPPKLLAGQPATLAVIDNQGRLLPKAPVDLSAGQHVTTDATGRALFIAPTEP